MLNTGGACKSIPGRGGIGGERVIRSADGSWILGFAKAFHYATNNQIELLELSEGLRLVKEHNLFPIEINIDATEVLSWLANETLFYDSIIDEYRLKLRRLERPMVSHCFREQNGAADTMVKLGV